MTTNKLTDTVDVFFHGSHQALLRAARRVREEARRTNSKLVIVHNDEILHLTAAEMDALEAQEATEDAGKYDALSAGAPQV